MPYLGLVLMVILKDLLSSYDMHEHHASKWGGGVQDSPIPETWPLEHYARAAITSIVKHFQPSTVWHTGVRYLERGVEAPSITSGKTCTTAQTHLQGVKGFQTCQGR